MIETVGPPCMEQMHGGPFFVRGIAAAPNGKKKLKIQRIFAACSHSKQRVPGKKDPLFVC